MHAEHHAITKLKNRFTNSLKKLDILVIKTSKTNLLIVLL